MKTKLDEALETPNNLEPTKKHNVSASISNELLREEERKYINIDRSLIEFAVNYIWMEAAIENGVYREQSTLEEDMQKLVDDGKLPSGWYKLKEALDT